MAEPFEIECHCHVCGRTWYIRSDDAPGDCCGVFPDESYDPEEVQGGRDA